MSKTSKQTQTQQIDPQIRAESEALTSLARRVAGMGYNPYQGNTVADFTPGQRAAFTAADQAASAFGMPTGASTGGPTGSTEGAYGIRGFSPQQTLEAQQKNLPELTRKINAIFEQASRETPKQAPLGGGGGKK